MTRFIRAASTAVLLAATLLVAACASSGPTAKVFGPQSQTALLVLAGPKYPFAVNTGFRRVDLATNTFAREYEGFGTGIMGSQINRDGPVYFSTREVMPGDYALVSLLGVPGTAQIWTCMPAGGPVFTLRAGTLTIVRTDPYWRMGAGVPQPAATSDAAVLQAFETARAAYPDLVGDARVASPAATIRWRSGGMGMTRNCSESPTFERIM
ncbi:MAG TPA: hypothetical protein VN018_05885 [Brevundimonas sp.]|nr:hypothetical protein [Brevundimonas sp.]